MDDSVFGENQRKKVLILLCILLGVLLAGMLMWSKRKDAADVQKLQELSSEPDKETSEKVETETEKDKKEPEEEPITEKEPEENVIEEAKEIVCWGDELLPEESAAIHSYKVHLQNLLTENGYGLPVLDKTLQGAGTMSMMTMAGVSEETVQSYITAHIEGAGGNEIPVTETGIRDLTPEQLERNDLDCIPVIFMGYYGGWNHDPTELAGQQENILKTFPQQERFLIVGTRPLDGSVDSASLDAVMREKWGEHYISLAELTTEPAESYDTQAVMAQGIFQKLETLGYISK